MIHADAACTKRVHVIGYCKLQSWPNQSLSEFSFGFGVTMQDFDADGCGGVSMVRIEGSEPDLWDFSSLYLQPNKRTIPLYQRCNQWDWTVQFCSSGQNSTVEFSNLKFFYCYDLVAYFKQRVQSLSIGTSATWSSRFYTWIWHIKKIPKIEL